MTVSDLFLERKNTPHNIDQHLDTLFELAHSCDTIVELGTERGWSTSAFLFALPDRIDCFDWCRTPEVDLLEEAALKSGVEFTFWCEDTRSCTIPFCDLLFIDTEHTYEQVKAELERHGNRAQRYLVFHDTETFPAILPAIFQFVRDNPHWQLKEHFTHQHGLTIYERSADNG